MTVIKIVIRFCKNIGKFCNEINKNGGGIFFWRMEFSKMGKRDFAFIRKRRVSVYGGPVSTTDKQIGD